MTAPALTVRVAIVVAPAGLFCSRPPAMTWISPLPLLQTNWPAPVPIVHVAVMRRTAPVMMQMSPPVQVVSSCGRTLTLSSNRS